MSLCTLVHTRAYMYNIIYFVLMILNLLINVPSLIRIIKETLIFFLGLCISQATEERYRNKGAYIILEPPYFDTPVFHSFEAVTPRPKVTSSTNQSNIISRK